MNNFIGKLDDYLDVREAYNDAYHTDGDGWDGTYWRRKLNEAYTSLEVAFNHAVDLRIELATLAAKGESDG